MLTLRIEDQGAVPAGPVGPRRGCHAIDGGAVADIRGADERDAATAPDAGSDGGAERGAVHHPRGPRPELTDATHAAGGARSTAFADRLSVLLVSGEPHPGQRTWRKPAEVRPLGRSRPLHHPASSRTSRTGVPVTELSPIAFPTRELFMEAVDDFDLIIFDRYQRRGILPMLYIDNIRRYVEDGGALLCSRRGPDYASCGLAPTARPCPNPAGAGLPARGQSRRPSCPRSPALGETPPSSTAGLAASHEPLADSDQPWARWNAPDRGDGNSQGRR